MIAKTFVDTNIWVYSKDVGQPAKQALANEVIEKLWANHAGVVSTQVLSEFYVTVTQKLKPGLPRETAWNIIEALKAWDPIPINTQRIQQAYAIQSRFDISWWDSLIVAAAQHAGCTTLLSEDLQAGMVFEELVIVNPFA